MRNFLLFFVLVFGSIWVSWAQDGTCSITGKEENHDPALKAMNYTIRGVHGTFLAYVEPDVATFYQDSPPPSLKKMTPKYKGLANKFINNSKKRCELVWEGGSKQRPNRVPMGVIPPFSCSGTAAHPGHRFLFAEPGNHDTIYKRFTVGFPPDNLYIYDPYTVDGDPEATEANLQKEELSESERGLYLRWRDTIEFNEIYTNFTGRAYLANFLRYPPKHFMWPASHFGQQHWVETKETHFRKMPSDDQLLRIVAPPKQRVLKTTDPRLLQEYRDPNQSTLNLTLTVLSLAPRVFEIPNFLSETEVDHILKLATGAGLKRSTVGDVGGNKKEEIKGNDNPIAKTRTSTNSWLSRETSPVVDAIYRRAADVMRIDEALLRHRHEDEFPEWPHPKSVAEKLQLVHYSEGQEYTAHVSSRFHVHYIY